MRPTIYRTTAALVGLALTGAALAAPPTPASAAPSRPATEAAEGAKPSTDAELRRALRRVERAGAVGVVAEVVDRGDRWRGATGDARLRPASPARPDARFRSASVTKQLTTVLALQLVERGRWSFDTTIGDVLPGLWPGRGDVTLAQLLSHTSGVPDFLPALISRALTGKKFVRVVSERRTDRALVRRAQRLDWLFEPGTGYGYSNTGFVLVGMMLRKETGRPLRTLMANRVLEPAGMDSSEFAMGRRMEPPRLREYADFGRPLDLNTFSPTMFSGAGAVVSTAPDLNRFQQALSEGRLLAPRLVTRMRSVVTDAEAAGVPYGYGSYRLPDPCRPGRSVYGHDGGSWGTVTYSMTSADGRRRVTVAMTGRQLVGKKQPATLEVVRFVQTAFATTCRGEATSRSPAPTMDDVLPRLAGTPGR